MVINENTNDWIDELLDRGLLSPHLFYVLTSKINLYPGKRLDAKCLLKDS